MCTCAHICRHAHCLSAGGGGGDGGQGQRWRENSIWAKREEKEKPGLGTLGHFAPGMSTRLAPASSQVSTNLQRLIWNLTHPDPEPEGPPRLQLIRTRGQWTGRPLSFIHRTRVPALPRRPRCRCTTAGTQTRREFQCEAEQAGSRRAGVVRTRAPAPLPTPSGAVTLPGTQPLGGPRPAALPLFLRQNPPGAPPPPFPTGTAPPRRPSETTSGDFAATSQSWEGGVEFAAQGPPPSCKDQGLWTTPSSCKALAPAPWVPTCGALPTRCALTKKNPWPPGTGCLRCPPAACALRPGVPAGMRSERWVSLPGQNRGSQVTRRPLGDGLLGHGSREGKFPIPGRRLPPQGAGGRALPAGSQAGSHPGRAAARTSAARRSSGGGGGMVGGGRVMWHSGRGAAPLGLPPPTGAESGYRAAPGTAQGDAAGGPEERSRFRAGAPPPGVSNPLGGGFAPPT